MDRRAFSISVLGNLAIPFAAAAATDITGRVIDARLSQLWVQPVMIDNRGGGNGLPAG